MATPATISLEGFPTAILYKHWDGYPEATLQWLIDFNQDFIANRGDDPEYKFAQLLRSSAFEAEKYGLDPWPSKHTGWGVYPNTPDALSMGAFSYQLMKDGTVMVKEQD